MAEMKRIATTALCLLLATGASAGERQDHGEIVAAARNTAIHEAESAFPGARIEVTTGRLDPRLLLPSCPAPLEAFRTTSTPPAGNVTIGVRCPASTEWKIYVSTSVAVHVPVVVLSASQARGAIIGPGDISLEERNISTLAMGYLLDPERATGMELRRGLSVGAVLTANVLTQPRIVQRGQSVTLLAEGTGIVVRMAGEALQDGTLGERIRVRNTRSRRIVEGVVDGPGVVRVII